MKKYIILIIFFSLFLLAVKNVFADLAPPPQKTIIIFNKNGQPYYSKVDFEITCFGYHFSPGEPDTPPPFYNPKRAEKLFYTKNSGCEYKCEIVTSFYRNYSHIDHCDLLGETEGKKVVCFSNFV